MDNAFNSVMTVSAGHLNYWNKLAEINTFNRISMFFNKLNMAASMGAQQSIDINIHINSVRRPTVFTNMY